MRGVVIGWGGGGGGGGGGLIMCDTTNEVHCTVSNILVKIKKNNVESVFHFGLKLDMVSR